MAMSNYWETKSLDVALGNNATYTGPASGHLYGSLHTGDPTETGTGAPLASTPRMPVVFNAAVNSTAVNATTVTWTCSATGTVSHMALWDGSATATANCMYYGALTASKTVANAGDQVQAASGAIKVVHD